MSKLFLKFFLVYNFKGKVEMYLLFFSKGKFLLVLYMLLFFMLKNEIEDKKKCRKCFMFLRFL